MIAALLCLVAMFVIGVIVGLYLAPMVDEDERRQTR